MATKRILTPPHPRTRERILGYGDFGVGKSMMWLDIATALASSKHHMYLIDSDNAWEKAAVEGWGWLEDDGVLKVYEAFDFTEAYAASLEIRKKARRGDWVAIDMMDMMWEYPQVHYINESIGQDPVDYFTQMRREVKEAERKGRGHKAQFGGQEGMDWTFITKIYKQFETPLTMKTRAHIIGVTGEKKLDENRGASKEALKRFSMTGLGKMGPAGQKGIGHRFDTILRITQKNDGTRQMTMAKDRNREHLWLDEDGKGRTRDIGTHPRAFHKAYLRDVVGWTREKVE
jgi:hypothetical protein